MSYGPCHELDILEIFGNFLGASRVYWNISLPLCVLQSLYIHESLMMSILMIPNIDVTLAIEQHIHKVQMFPVHDTGIL